MKIYRLSSKQWVQLTGSASLLFLFSSVNAAVVFEDHLITILSNGVSAVSSIDMDADGDVDLLAASGIPSNSQITWFENDGQNQFISHVIGNAGGQNVGPESISAADVDGDNDFDVIVAVEESSKIIWYENLDGNGAEFGLHIVRSDASFASSAQAADLDGDNDLDLFSASGEGVSWYENTGHQFFSEHIVTHDPNLHTKSVISADIDNDGDLDLVSASENRRGVIWHENRGAGNFPNNSDYRHVISDSLDGPQYVEKVDLDQDGDIDILVTTFRDNKTTWHENDGHGVFTQHIVSESVRDGRSVSSADVDNDGDLDIFSGFQYVDGILGGKVVWYENDGNQNFSEHVIDELRGHRIEHTASADIDNDGDVDLLAGTITGKFIWYENKALVTQSNNWNLIGLPCAPESTENTVADIFSDDIPGILGTDWSILRYIAGTGYEPLTINDAVRQGEGYWLIQKNPNNQAVTIDLPESCDVTPVNQPIDCPAENGCYEIPLATTEDSLSWNLIGYPFDPRSHWDQLRIIADGDCASGCTPAEAQTAGIMYNNGWRFSSKTGQYQSLSDGVLDRWYGLWVVTLEQAYGKNLRLLIPKE